MNRRMTTGSPARAANDKAAVVDGPDYDLSRRHARALNLGVAPEAQVKIRLGEQLGVDGSMRLVARSAAFAHGLVRINEGTGLLPMALRA